MATSTISELVISFLFDTKEGQKSAKQAEQIVQNVADKAIKALTAIGTFDFLKGAVTKFTNAASQIGYFSKIVGENVSTLNEWQQAVVQNGGSAEQFNGTLQTLTQSLKDYVYLNEGGQVGNVLYNLGVSARDAQGHLKKTTEVIKDVSAAIQGKSQQQQVYILQKLFGNDYGLIRLAQQGPKAIQKIIDKRRELGVLNQNDANTAIRFKNILNDLNQQFTFLEYKIGEMLIPVLEKFFKYTEKGLMYIKKNWEHVAPFIWILVGKLSLSFLKLFGILSIKRLPALSLFYALGLLLDDIMTYLRGGHSAFGKYYKEIGEGVNKVKKWVEAHQGIEKVLKKIWPFLLAAPALIKAMAVSIKTLNTIKMFTPLGIALTGIIVSLGIIIADIEKLKSIASGDELKKIWGDNTESLKLELKGGWKDKAKALLDPLHIFHNVRSSRFESLDAKNSAFAKSIQSRNNSTVHIGTIQVNTKATDANGIAKGIAQGLNKQFGENLMYHVNNFDSGLRQ